MRRAVFLDRDGTIIEDVGYLSEPDRLRLLPGAAQAIRRLRAVGFAVVVVTNQSGIARGLLDETDLQAIHARLERELGRRGAALDAIYYCPHHPEIGPPAYRRACACRKPRAGMVRRAVADLGLALPGSYVVGDKASDVAMGRRVGCRTALIGPGELAAEARPDFVAPSLLAAAGWILDGRKVEA